jgi:hypothetical protein
MWKVTAPSISAVQAMECCTSVADHRQAAVRQCAGEIMTASTSYMSAAKAGEIHTLQPRDFALTHVSSDEMKWLYNNRLYRGPGRGIYEAIKSAPKHRICPMCGVREVRDLDHVLPKATFAALAIDPSNLVPVCAECNNLKGEYFPPNATEQFIHPYFDDLEGVRWLYATILEDKPVTAFAFKVRPQSDWHPDLAARVQWQFERFKLARLYTSYAGRELARIRGSLARIYSREGASGVQFRLTEDAESRLSDETNSWNSAMYEAMATSAWFCNGGFAQV